MMKEKFNETVGSLFDGMEGFLTSKTVVGEPIQIKDTIILPLVDVTFGMGAGTLDADKKNKSGGGIGGKLTPSAVLVIRNGSTKLVNVKNQETITKLLDMVPDVIDKFTKKDETLEDIVDDLEKEE
ncbi:MAG: GerW family sporulation protein [Anaerostipes sp.]|nr:GerW family sporulation protein [Anaerostipes sp.]